MTRSHARVQPSTGRMWRLYRFYDNAGRLLYIGQTGREPLARLIEHLYEQAWAGEVARWEADPRLFASEAQVLTAEEAAIRAEKPIRNWVHNEGPHRQWLPKAGAYRHPGRRLHSLKLPPRWRRRRNRALLLAAVWLAVTLTSWWADVACTAVDVPGRSYPIVGVYLAACVPACRARRRRDRRLAVAVVTVVCAVLWAVTG